MDGDAGRLRPRSAPAGHRDRLCSRQPVCLPGLRRGGLPSLRYRAQDLASSNFFQHQAYLNARVPRVRCGVCGIRTVSVPWARPDSGFTLLFEALIMTMVSAMPVKAVARMVGEHDTRLWRVVHHYVDQARARIDTSDVTQVAIDETAARRGHDYITLFVDIDQARVLFATEGKDAETVGAFAAEVTAHGGDPEAIEEVCVDMSPAFIKGVAENLPNAAITFDKFHAVKIVNDAVNQVRRIDESGKTCCAAPLYLAAQPGQPVRPTARDTAKPANPPSQDRAGLPDTAHLPGALPAGTPDRQPRS